MSARYVLIRNGVNEGTILWDSRTPYDPGRDFELVEESKYDGPPRVTVEPDPTADEVRIRRLEAKFDALKAVPEITAKVDLDAVKGAGEKLAHELPGRLGER